MVTVEDKSGLFTWWYEQLGNNQDWNNLSKIERKLLLTKLQQCMISLADLNITSRELTPLIVATDVPTVFDAILSLWSLDKNQGTTRYGLVAYLKKTVINAWKVKHIKTIKWHKEEVNTKRKKKGEPITAEQALKYSPYNLVCSVCGNAIRSRNKTGICNACNKNVEK